MGGDHHHGPPYTVPDYKIYKAEGIAQLEELKTALAVKGLKDPWIRNEVWRYNPAFGTPLQRARSLFFRGFGVGLALTAITVGITAALGGDKGHDHDDHH